MLSGPGPAWPLAPEDRAPTPAWINGRAFPAVWRDTLAFATGSLIATKDQFPQMRPGKPWNHRPPPESDADEEQAIAAKIHLSLRLLPLLAEAKLVVVEPAQVAALPGWRTDDEEAVYSAEAVLPCSPVFLDFEAVDGSPIAWRRETWPLPFYLRGALCWSQDELLSIVPFGSVGSSHPWGGTDYQAWARWIYLQGHSSDWPAPGPGDFVTRASGDACCWVNGEEDSVCAQHGSVAYNLCRRVLSVLMCLEAFEVDLIPEPASRQVRRRAERRGEKIGLVPRSWPIPAVESDSEATPEERGAVVATAELVPEDRCPIPKTHARLNQCHEMWHEALDSYASPDSFVSHLNALIQGLRTVTFVLKKELSHHDGFHQWYKRRQEAMEADKRMKWLVSARNRIEKQGDLDTHSVVQVRVMGDWHESPAVETEADPTMEAHEIARRVHVLGLPERARREGVLVVERRWTLEELAGDEILDVLAHCHGVLTNLVAAAHDEWGTEDGAVCALNLDGVCEGTPMTPHPSGRVPCMLASRRSRTARRDLQSGALVEVDLQPYSGPAMGPDELLERYGPHFPFEAPAPGADVFDLAEAFHEWGRQLLATDGKHVTLAWLLDDSKPLRQITLYPKDQRDKYLAIERIAEEVDRLGANEIVFTTEAWEAAPVGPDDSRAKLRAGERDDRTEAFLTYVLRRGGECRIWRSPMIRTDDGLELAEATVQEEPVPVFLEPVMRVWSSWEA